MSHPLKRGSSDLRADNAIQDTTAQPVRLRRPWGLTMPQLWAFVVLLAIFISLSLILVRPHDFWWHVRVGQWIIENGRVPTVDLFSYTRLGQPYTYEMWLMEVALFLLYRAGGLPLVIFFHAIVITCGYGLLLCICRREAGGDLRMAALVTLAAAALGLYNWNVRPQTISFLLFALTLFLLERHAARDRAGQGSRWGSWVLWGLPPLFVLWANCHGGFVYGLALVGVELLAALLLWLRRRGRFPAALALVTLLSGVATLLTPQGLGMVSYVLGIFRHPVIQQLTVEWVPPTVRDPDGMLFFGCAAVLIALLLVSGHRPSARDSIRLLLFGLLALMARRNAPWFGFVAAPVMAASLNRLTVERARPARARHDRPRLNAVLAAWVGLVALFGLPWFRPGLPLPEWRRAYVSDDTPVEAVAFLKTLPQPSRVFQSEGYGSYMIWASPEIPVFADTRLELYPLEQWKDFLALSYARYDWEAILRTYAVDTLFLERKTQGSLVEAASAASGWQRVFEDERTVIFRRRGP